MKRHSLNMICECHLQHFVPHLGGSILAKKPENKFVQTNMTPDDSTYLVAVPRYIGTCEKITKCMTQFRSVFSKSLVFQIQISIYVEKYQFSFRGRDLI